MSQYAHFPVKGDTFWQRYRNACFQWIKWWDFPVMTCAECGVRIIPSIPAMILNDVCYMIGLFFLPLGIVFSGLASAGNRFLFAARGHSLSVSPWGKPAKDETSIFSRSSPNEKTPPNVGLHCLQAVRSFQQRGEKLSLIHI